MSEREHRDDCGWLDDVAVELALGLLDGADRAAALAHVERCGACQVEVASLTATGEQLLLVAPEVPPPDGFETRVLDRIASAPERLRALGRSGAGSAAKVGAAGSLGTLTPAGASWRDRRRRRSGRGRLLAVAATIVALGIVAGAVGLGQLRDDDPEIVTTQMISARGRDVGEVVVRDTSPVSVELDVEEWVDAVKDAGRWVDGQWWLTVEDDLGDVQQYKVALEESAVMVELDHPARDGEALSLDDLSELGLVDHTGTVWCTAQIA